MLKVMKPSIVCLIRSCLSRRQAPEYGLNPKQSKDLSTWCIFVCTLLSYCRTALHLIILRRLDAGIPVPQRHNASTVLLTMCLYKSLVRPSFRHLPNRAVFFIMHPCYAMKSQTMICKRGVVNQGQISQELLRSVCSLECQPRVPRQPG